MINKINNHFILVDRCAEETRIVEVFDKKIIKLITWFDKNPPLIGNIYNAVIVKKLNGGVARAKIYDKSILTIRGVPNSIKVNTSVRIIVTSDKTNNKPIQSKLIEPNSKFEEKIKNLDQINKIILLFFSKKLPIIKDEFSILWHELNLDKCYLDALKSKIKLNKGGVIWIEKTNAATLIDIDTKNLSIKTEDHMLKFCELAFVKCMEEIKLRNIGGMVLIDFPKLSNIRRKTFSNYLAETGKKYICDGIFFWFF